MRATLLIIACAWLQPAHAIADDEPRNPTVATTLSLVPTLAGYAIVIPILASDNRSGLARIGAVTGMTLAAVGPSVGHFYAGKWEQMTPGAYMRLGAVPVAIAGFLTIAAECESVENCEAPTPKSKYVFAAAGVLWFGGTILDVATAHRAARKYNEKHRVIVVTPTYAPDAGAGLALTGSF